MVVVASSVATTVTVDRSLCVWIIVFAALVERAVLPFVLLWMMFIRFLL